MEQLDTIRRRGIFLVWVAILLVALMAFVSLGVDLGRVQLAKTELQRAADAAARYGVTGLSDSTYQTKAQAAASANDCLGSAIVLTSTDIELGTWAGNTFTSGGTSPNALRVTARRIASRGSAVPLLFAKVLGLNGCDVNATSIAKREPGIASGYIGLEGIDVKNNLFAASYDSSSNPNPSQSSHLNSGMIGSNGDITAKHNEVVGQVVLGPDGSHNLDLTSGATVLDDPIPAPTIDFSGAPASNPSGTPQNLNVAGTVNLPAGTYYFTSVTLGNNAQLSFLGPATVYVDGNVTFSQNGSISGYGNLPANLRIRQRGAGSVFGSSSANNVTLVADIEAPQSDFSAKNSAVLMGRGFFKSISAKNNLELYYDQTLQSYLPDVDASSTIALVR